jgi:DNA-binding NarL/FixJ family response regulator
LLQGIPSIQVIGEANTVAQGFRLIAECCPNIVILDLSFREGNGFEILKQIRAKQPKIKTIVFSNSDEFYRNIALKIGADYYLDKTKDLALLEAVITKIAS